MIVEFIGLPGSGKSTLCEDLEPWLESEGYEVINWIYHTAFMGKIHRISHKLKVSTLFFIAHPVLFKGTYKLVRISKQRSKKDVITQLLNLVYISALYYRFNKKKYEKNIVLFDQGKVQAMTSLFYSSGVNEIHSLLSDPLLDQYSNSAVVQIELSVSESLQRLSQRKGAQSRIERLDPEERESALEQFKKAGEEVLKNKELCGHLLILKGRGLGKQEALSKAKELLKRVL